MDDVPAARSIAANGSTGLGSAGPTRILGSIGLSDLRRSMASTVSVARGVATASPISGTRPSSVMTSPARVS